MTRKELKTKEKEENRVLKNEGKICTSIDRDGSRTIEAKETSRKAAEEKRRRILKEKIEEEKANGAAEAHIYCYAKNQMRRLQKQTQAIEKV